MDFVPRILLLVCNGSPYGALNIAGLNRRQIPANYRPLRITCSGEISVGTLLKAFEIGFEGVMVLACPQDSCHYERGNIQAEVTVKQARAALDFIGISSSRLRMELLGALEDEALARILYEFAELLESMGPMLPTGAHKGEVDTRSILAQ